MFSAAADGQSSVDIKVYQGEREMTTDNKLLSSSILIRCICSYRLRAQSSFQSSGGLGKGDIERMVREAEQYASQDKKRRVYTCSICIAWLSWEQTSIVQLLAPQQSRFNTSIYWSIKALIRHYLLEQNDLNLVMMTCKIDEFLLAI